MKPLTNDDLPTTVTVTWTPSMVDKFFAAYLECALWSSTDNADDSSREPLDSNYSPDDIPEDVRERLRAECIDFVAANCETLDKAGADFAQHGHDFWLTRNRHGGFWDRGYGEVGHELTEAARAYLEVYLYVGDDGQVWAAGYEGAKAHDKQ